jgi:hypothetical protein
MWKLGTSGGRANMHAASRVGQREFLGEFEAKLESDLIKITDGAL